MQLVTRGTSRSTCNVTIFRIKIFNSYSPGDYATIFTEPEENNCFSIITQVIIILTVFSFILFVSSSSSSSKKKKKKKNQEIAQRPF